MAAPILIPYLKINPSYLALYNQVVYPEGRSYDIKAFRSPPEKHDHNGLISKKAERKIKSAIDWLILIANNKVLPSSLHGRNFLFKLSFITLTLSSKQIHTDNEIKEKIFNHFLVEARKKWNLRHYLWRAETQSNGNIHFHIVCDRFIPWSQLRDTWNRIQNKYGYVDAYREQMRSFHRAGFQVRQDLLKSWSYKNQIRAYRSGSKKDWNSPNSTDVHSIWKIKNLSAYLSKYCTKNQPGRALSGRLWGLSESLSSIYSTSIEIDSHISSELEKICHIPGARIYEDKYFSIIYIDIRVWWKSVDGFILSAVREVVERMRSYP